jgi:hypothetical protein
VRPITPRQIGRAGGAKGASPSLRSWWQWSERRGPCGPRATSYPGHTPGPDEGSGGPKGGGRHPGAPARGTRLRRWSQGLDADRLPCPWPRAILFVAFFIDLSLYIYRVRLYLAYVERALSIDHS